MEQTKSKAEIAAEEYLDSWIEKSSDGDKDWDKTMKNVASPVVVQPFIAGYNKAIEDQIDPVALLEWAGRNEFLYIKEGLFICETDNEYGAEDTEFTSQQLLNKYIEWQQNKKSE